MADCYMISQYFYISFCKEYGLPEDEFYYRNPPDCFC